LASFSFAFFLNERIVAISSGFVVLSCFIVLSP
jgi:hypothetical protein